MHDGDDDVRLMLALRAGDESAFDVLFARWSGPVAPLSRTHGARRRLRGGTRAGDLSPSLPCARALPAGRAFLDLALHDRDAPRAQRAAATATPAARTAAPTRRTTTAARWSSRADAPRADDVAHARRVGDSVEQALAALPERQRVALWLSAVEGLSYAEVAASLETSEKSVKALVHRARCALAGVDRRRRSDESTIAERCAPFDDDLSALLDGQLDAPRAADVRAHARVVRDCARRLAALRGVDTALRHIAAAPLDASRRERMRSAVAMGLRDEASGAAQCASPLQRTPPRRRRWLVPAGFAAAAAAAAAIFFVTRTQPPVALPAERVVVAAAERVAPKLRADAEAAARALTAHGDAPLGASAPPSDEVATTPPDRELLEQLELLETLAALSPDARARLDANLARWQALSPEQREQLRERRDALLRERNAQRPAAP